MVLPLFRWPGGQALRRTGPPCRPPAQPARPGAHHPATAHGPARPSAEDPGSPARATYLGDGRERRQGRVPVSGGPAVNSGGPPARSKPISGPVAANRAVPTPGTPRAAGRDRASGTLTAGRDGRCVAEVIAEGPFVVLPGRRPPAADRTGTATGHPAPGHAPVDGLLHCRRWRGGDRSRDRTRGTGREGLDARDWTRGTAR